MSWPHSFHDYHAWLLIACYPGCWLHGYIAAKGRFLPRRKPPHAFTTEDATRPTGDKE